MVLLARHGTNISIYFLGLFTRLLIYIKASNVSCKLGLNYNNCHLSLDGNAYLRGASLNTRLLYILYKLVISPHFAILPLEV
jgi:hypothetical protein